MVEVAADLMVEDGAGGTRRLSVNDLQDEKLTLRLDEDGVLTYVGEAVAGTDDADAAWRIKLIDETAGLEITWADGNTLFDNRWDQRATLDYV